ncbi:MAG: Phosphoglycerate mutase [Lachnoclostridium sp.]|jgi:broad specificity phosphatase PhoE
MQIYLIRHGKQNSTLCNVDVELSKEGFMQADLLGKRLENYEIEAIYSSHLIRAVQTAQVVNKYVKKNHYIRENIAEISFGEMEGKSDEYINEHFAEFKTEQMKLKEDIPYPGGECGRDVYKRAILTINEIIQTDYNKVAVITHGGVIRALIAGLFGINMAKKLLLGFSLENTSITELVYDKKNDRFYLQRFNDYAHLESRPELIRCNR